MDPQPSANNLMTNATCVWLKDYCDFEGPDQLELCRTMMVDILNGMRGSGINAYDEDVRGYDMGKLGGKPALMSKFSCTAAINGLKDPVPMEGVLCFVGIPGQGSYYFCVFGDDPGKLGDLARCLDTIVWKH